MAIARHSPVGAHLAHDPEGDFAAGEVRPDRLQLHLADVGARRGPRSDAERMVERITGLPFRGEPRSIRSASCRGCRRRRSSSRRGATSSTPCANTRRASDAVGRRQQVVERQELDVGGVGDLRRLLRA